MVARKEQKEWFKRLKAPDNYGALCSSPYQLIYKGGQKAISKKLFQTNMEEIRPSVIEGKKPVPQN